MTEEKMITELDEITSPANGDLVPLVDDPLGTPETVFSKLENLGLGLWKYSSFTPTFSLANPGTETFTSYGATRIGDLYRCGPLVYVLCQVSATYTSGTGTGTLFVGDIPLLGILNVYQPIAGVFAVWARTNYYQAQPRIHSNSGKMSILVSGPGVAIGALSHSDLTSGNTLDFRVSGLFLTSS
jgi:hypothetical protein